MSDGFDQNFWSSRMALIAGLFLGALILGSGLMFFLLPSADQKGLIVIEASQTPYKSKPDESGGKAIDHKDKDVFDLLDQLKSAENNGELLKLPDPAPEMPPVAVATSDDDTSQDSENTTAPTQSVDTQNQDTAPAKSEPQAAEQTKTASLTSDTPKAEEDNLSSVSAPATPSADNTQVPEDTEAEEVAEAPKPEPEETKPNRIIKKPVVKAGAQPVMMVQIAAFQNQTKAEEVAAVMSNKHKDRLMGLVLGVMPTDTASGVYWRVITEALPEADARKICDNLKRAGQDCILRKIKPAS